MRKLLAGVLLLLAACSTTRYDLGPEWAPLTRLQQASWVADDTVTTIAGVAYTNDLDGYLRSQPPGSLEFNALMTHERVHALDEQELGAQFYVDYAAFPAKRWEFESKAWVAQIAYYKAHGFRPSPNTAEFYGVTQWYAVLASERYWGMIGYDQALAWFAKEWAR